MDLRTIPLVAGAALLFASGSAHASCTLTDLQPTGTMPIGPRAQRFSFVASSECAVLELSSGSFTRTPVAGAPTGPDTRAYHVLLSRPLWQSLLVPGAATFEWRITGWTTAGVATMVDASNELDLDGDGWTRTAGDVGTCDRDASRNPGVVEICGDGADSDCDGNDCVVVGPFDLADADATLIGENEGDTAGYSVSGAGDVDGDGNGDLLVGAVNYTPGDYRGAAYLFHGPVSGEIDLGTADGRFLGTALERVGRSVSGAGDVNDDGLADILIGAPSYDSSVDTAGFVVFGPATGSLDPTLADVVIHTAALGYSAGECVSDAGDTNGDGHDDVLVSAANEDGAGRGAAYVVLGPLTSADSDLGTAAKLTGTVDAAFVGYSVSGAGDVDGDGLDDIVLGAPYDDDGGDYAGAAYVVFGPVTLSRDLGAADVKLIGEVSGYETGLSVSGAGDVDGDGWDDVVVGAAYPPLVGTGDNEGKAYIVLGPVSADLPLSSADAKLIGEASFDDAGWSVSDAGDVDGDGNGDVLVGAPNESTSGFRAGAAYLLLGPISGTHSLAEADRKLVGPQEYDRAGASVSGAGDADGDGLDDLLIGASGYHGGSDPFSTGALGAAFVVYGSSL